MSVVIKIIDNLYRLVEEETGKIALSKNGHPMDGGGHKQADTAIRQASYINVSPRREEDKE